ncbi:MAG: LuxR C-terminal-related transcriptional regulator, partial [Streptosporangiaceae bacterium]
LPSEFLDRLLTAWSAVTGPLVVVLEDVHHLQSPEITEDLGFVIEHLPGRSRMLLTSRVDPRLPVSRWRGRSWLAELRQRDLALTLPETAELFTALGEHRLAASEIETLWRHTEGWVAGLRLAAAGLKDRADVSAAVDQFSGRTPVVADLLTDELLRRAPKELSEFLLRTSVADVLDAELCDTLSGRSDSAEVLRRMEADLQFVMATGPGRDTWRYHPLLAEMLRSELQAHRPDEVQELNHLAAVLLQARGDIAGAVRCLLAAGDTDRAFSLVFEAAYRRADLSDTPGIAAFINLFPQELVTESASRMLTYALMLGLAGQVAEAHAWLQRAQMRISDEPTARAEDVATLDVLRLLTFTVSAGAGDEIDAGRRAVEAVEAGLDLGVAGARARMNLVRGYLLVDEPGEADSVLRAGSPGDEIAALVLAPALAARIALREGRLSEAGRQATAALEAAQAFGLDTHPGAVDAHLALAGALIDRNELADATAAFRRLDEVIQANPFTLVYQVLVRLEKVRVAAALNDFDNVFATVSEAGKLIDHLPRSALRCLVDAAAARWHLEAGQTRRAEGPAVARLARAAAESLGTESGTILSVALGSPPPSRSTPRQPTPIFTERELSVLQFLPTHLTNAEIAGECFMSVNTVKTHLKNIYAKLGVTSRAETVERARLLGLL